MTIRIAFLGLGLMGSAMARRLIDAGFAITVWNRTEEKTRHFLDSNVTAVNRASEAVLGASIVCLCLSNAKAVDQVWTGEHPVRGAIAPGAVVIDFSTIGVSASRKFAADAAQMGVHWLDCPVSGGVTGARAGELVALCGGSAEAFDLARPVLDVLSTRATHLGEAGAGQAAKLCNQLLVSIQLLAIAEAVALAEALGVNAERLPEALEGGFADSKPLQIFGPRMAKRSYTPTLGTIAMMAKDVRQIMEAADNENLALPLMARAYEDYETADEQLGELDLSALILTNRGSAANHTPANKIDYSTHHTRRAGERLPERNCEEEMRAVIEDGKQVQ